METVCQGKQWDVLLKEDDGDICGAMPFLYGKKMGLKYILQPQLTPWSGPWLRHGMDFTGQQNTLGTLADALRDQKASLCMQCFSPEITDWQPFHWRGFRQTTRYTYRIPLLDDIDALYRDAPRLRRRYDKGVEAECFVDPTLSLDEFVPFHVAYYKQKGQSDLIPGDLMRRVITSSCIRKQGLLWGLRQRSDNKLMAAWFVAFDDQCGWSLLLALSKEAPHGAMSFLIWQVLRHLSTLTRSFDFEGGMDYNLAYFYNSFGATQTPYHCVYHSRIPFGEKLLHL